MPFVFVLEMQIVRYVLYSGDGQAFTGTIMYLNKWYLGVNSKMFPSTDLANII